MKTVVLSEDCPIDGVECVAGQLVTVPDGFPDSSIRRTVADPGQMRRQREFVHARIKALQERDRQRAKKER